MRRSSTIVLMLTGCFLAIGGIAALVYSQAVLHTLYCSGHCLQLNAVMGLGDFALLSYAGVILIALGVALFSLFSVVFAVQWRRTSKVAV